MLLQCSSSSEFAHGQTLLLPPLEKEQGVSTEIQGVSTEIWSQFSWRNVYGIKGNHIQPAKIKRGREEGDGTENVINCRKLSWHFMTNFMTIYDVLCQWNKETEIVMTCRKLSWRLSQIVMTFFFPVPFPPSPFGFRRFNSIVPYI